MPDPDSVDLRRLRLAHLDVGRTMYRVHDGAYPAAHLNTSARGDTRFAPLDGVGHLYVADTRTVALLETSFHDVHQDHDRVVYAAIDLAGRHLTPVEVVERVSLADLTDDGLARVGLTRQHLITTTDAHYPCTREWAQRLVGRRIGRGRVDGLLYNSRVAELAGDESPLLADLLGTSTSEAAVIYRPGTIVAIRGGYTDLVTGHGRLMVDLVAQQLGAEIA